MKRIIIFSLYIVSIAGIINLSIAGNITQRNNFSYTDLHIEKSEGFDLINLTDCELTDEIGAPQLPVKSLYFALPQGAKVNRVEVINSNSTILDNYFDIMPTQPPAILSKDYPIKRAEPNQALYNSLEPYPNKIVKFVGQGNFGKENIAMITLSPLQYIPKLQQLKFHYEITISLDYDSGTLKENNIGLIDNFNELTQFQTFDQSSEFEYLVITNSAMDTVFQRLCNWKTKKGIKAVTRDVNWITTNYSGRDNQEKVRNYLKTLYPDSGLVWLLLGGDVGIVPVRKAFAMPCSAGFEPREDSLPCDLYYADLDGTWDLNGNNVFGEVADSVDLFPEITVGRAPVNNISQARAFVNKILTYETNPPLDYQNRALFMGEILWPDPYTDGGVGKDWIDLMYVPPRFDPITKLYERLGNESRSSVVNAINQGKNLLNHNGHGNTQLMGVGEGYLRNSDMDNLTNGTRQGILYSIGCWTSAFDFDAIAEHYVRNPNGGGVAFIGNSSYGWGSPGNPKFGYSDRFDAQFYADLFANPAPHIGQVLALSKVYFIAHSRDANVYRWHQYQLNLLGEPEMMIATDSLKNLMVYYPSTIPLGENRIVITITDNGMPLRNALVCVQKGDEVYERDYTGFDGQVSLTINPATEGNLSLTATSHNFLPYETEIPVMSGAYISYLVNAINDSLGNNDHIPNPGELIGYSVLFKNEGTEPVNNISARLTYFSSEVTIFDSIESIGNLNPEESLLVDNGFGFNISNSVANGTVVCFTLTVTDVQNHTWNYQPSIIIGTPVINLINHMFTDSAPGGNNNGILEPGETVKLKLLVKNYGFGIGYDAQANISASDPNLTLLNPNTSFGDLLPDSMITSSTPLELRIESGCPSSCIIPIVLSMISSDYTFDDTILLFVGPTGLDDDFESGALGWTHGGTNDLWNLSQHNPHSPNNSFYCGNTSYRFINNMNCYLLSSPFMIQPSSVLTFWRWFLVPIYGVDGLYVIIESNHGSDTLDFIGTGGALGGDLDAIPGSWLQERYPLDSYLPGETLQVRFVFISDDEDVSEGFYLDDVRVSSEIGIEENFAVLPPKEIALSQNYPNPFMSKTTIYYNLPYLAKVNMKIYNRSGRLVKNLLNETKNAGYFYINWDGKDDNSQSQASGIYFLVFNIQNNQKSTTLRRKLLLLK
jgi:hypothetical protein